MDRLRLAAGVSLVETAALIAGIVAHDDVPPAGRLLIVAGLTLKVLMLGLLLRRSPGAALGVMLFEASAVLAALIGPGLALEIRGGLMVAAVATIALIASALHTFDPPRLPPLSQRPPH